MDKNDIATKLDLLALEGRLLEKLINELRKEKNKNVPWLKSSEAKKVLSCSQGTLQKMRISGDLPCTKILGTIYYSYEDILKLLE